MVEKRLTPVARKLRRASTDAENRLWYYLRSRRLDGAKFVRQEIIGPHIADFACRDLRLAIELDGGQHNEAVDAPRTEVIEAFSYRVIRFWNNDIFENLEGVIEVIQRKLAMARNDPLP
jgi:very-short-patch-repair endonuclease